MRQNAIGDGGGSFPHVWSIPTVCFLRLSLGGNRLDGRWLEPRRKWREWVRSVLAAELQEAAASKWLRLCCLDLDDSKQKAAALFGGNN